VGIFYIFVKKKFLGLLCKEIYNCKLHFIKRVLFRIVIKLLFEIEWLVYVLPTKVRFIFFDNKALSISNSEYSFPSTSL
jgi:hypothetical protein